MTVVLPFGHTFARQVLPRSNQLLTRLASSNSLLRVSYHTPHASDPLSTRHDGLERKRSVLTVRTYATAAAPKSVGRPKAHTGRSTAKKTPAKATKSATKKTPATKAKTQTRAKPRAKAKAKPKPKPRARKAAPSKSALEKARVARTKDLKTKALLNEPKQLPATAWAVCFTESRKGVKTFAEGAEKTKDMVEDYKHLSPEERERLNHTANQNRAKNITEYKKWLSQFTPLEIKEANHARTTLNAERKAKDGKKKAPIRLIKDERLVKQPISAYGFFTKDRFASGDFKHMTVPESARLIGKEWKALSSDEKKPFEDQSLEERNRYQQERSTVYGIEEKPKSPRKSRPAAAAAAST